MPAGEIHSDDRQHWEIAARGASRTFKHTVEQSEPIFKFLGMILATSAMLGLLYFLYRGLIANPASWVLWVSLVSAVPMWLVMTGRVWACAEIMARLILYKVSRFLLLPYGVYYIPYAGRVVVVLSAAFTLFVTGSIALLIGLFFVAAAEQAIPR